MPWTNKIARLRQRILDRRIERDLRTLDRRERFKPESAHIGRIALQVADGPSVSSQYRYIFRQECYDFAARGDQPLIIDCGANIGLAILYWKKRYPNSRVIAFEADPFIFKFLEQNCQAWDLHGVTLEKKALWTNEGTIRFSQNRADGGHISAGVGSSESIEIACTCLSRYLTEPVALLKMDIEGAELDVLEECRSQLHHVDKIFVEYHSFAGQPQKLDRLLTLLSEAGFRYHIHPELASPKPFRKIEVVNEKDLRLNIFGVRQA